MAWALAALSVGFCAIQLMRWRGAAVRLRETMAKNEELTAEVTRLAHEHTILVERSLVASHPSTSRNGCAIE